MGGNEALIKACTQAIPIYTMSYFLFPKGVVNELNRLVAGFWWGDSGSKRKIHWKKWIDLCSPKETGDLCFKDFESFNKALLAKQWWRIMHNEKLLSSRVLKGCYFNNSCSMQASLGSNYSYSLEKSSCG